MIADDPLRRAQPRVGRHLPRRAASGSTPPTGRTPSRRAPAARRSTWRGCCTPLGEDVTVVAPVGGPTGRARSRPTSSACGIPLVAVDDRGRDLRRTVTIVSDETGDATIVNEGCTIDRLAGVPRSCRRARWPGPPSWSRPGRCPTGAPVDAYARARAGAAARTACRSWSTRAARRSRPRCAARPPLIKPNLAELPDVTDVADPREAPAGCRSTRARRSPSPSAPRGSCSRSAARSGTARATRVAARQPDRRR